MPYQKRISTRRVAMLLSLMFGVAAVQPGFAAEQPAAEPATSSVTVTLINRLVERGVLSKKDSAELLLIAEADAAEARAQAALTQAALAQAAAAQARLKAVLAMTGQRQSAAEPAPSLSALAAAAEPAEEERPPVVTRAPHMPARTRVARAQAAPVVSAPTAEEPPAEETAPEPVVPAPHRAAPAPRRVAQAPAPAPAETVAASAPAEAPAAEEAVPEDVVRVTYVPEVVKAQLREEIKNDVMDQAREENWASPRAFPDWVTRFRLFGDVRFRYEGIHYPTGNDTGYGSSFWNYNAINTGAPYDYTDQKTPPPTANVDQNRNRMRLRARLGAGVDLGQNFSAGLRLATGENNSPVSQNQSFGAAGSGQGGNFSKYAVWLDRGFLKYELGGQPDNDYTFSFGRFDNPFLATNMIWADDLGFDGAVAQGRFSLGEDVTPFFALGAFPVFNTDLNFASNQPAKFKSNDKWLYGGQLGFNFEISKDFSAKIGAAYYLFKNIEGKVSSPLTNIQSASDAGDTDASRPAFAQKGNTYIALRDIVASTSVNNNGTTNQFQYFGLATPFHELAFTTQLEFNRFEPFQVVLTGEYVKNLAFDSNAILKNGPTQMSGPVNNNGTTFGGGNTGWIVNLKVGDAALKKRWDWNVNLGYRKLDSDAVVDGFNDSDFGGGGTNLKGFTFGGNVAFSPGVWVGLRWFSASEVTGHVFKNDIIQLDFNGKF